MKKRKGEVEFTWKILMLDIDSFEYYSSLGMVDSKDCCHCMSVQRMAIMIGAVL